VGKTPRFVPARAEKDEAGGAVPPPPPPQLGLASPAKRRSRRMVT
jgi:hypothetical protein